MEQRWLARARQRRYVLVKGKNTEAAMIDADRDAKDQGLLTARGVEEKVKVVRNDARGVVPFRLSVDVPRALLVLAISGVSYLLWV